MRHYRKQRRQGLRSVRILLTLAAAGLSVFPAGSDKRPLLVGWQEKASTQEEQIRQWWDSYPAALPAIVVGRAGLVVIDCDRHPGGNDGIKAFNELVSANGGNLANVPMIRTARGGAHLFFKQPTGEPLGKWARRVTGWHRCARDGRLGERTLETQMDQHPLRARGPAPMKPSAPRIERL
jgi:Bifunctional DNA primase/polymerase, N-terminal